MHRSTAIRYKSSGGQICSGSRRKIASPDCKNFLPSRYAQHQLPAAAVQSDPSATESVAGVHCCRRDALSALTAATFAGSNLPFAIAPSAHAAPESTAAAAAADALPLVPHTPLAPGSAMQISRVIKGCWQLSGGHKGEKETDRTGGNTAVQVRPVVLLHTRQPRLLPHMLHCAVGTSYDMLKRR